ncbi:MAG TPA: phenylacetic acid degradation bifunctional protein PaaZ, partial [Acidimicrobiaceae bacterium]|nr:phenylacetic acid degradation bifunctional protein PaaZ [Acidimicrobiaceae bacterium]
GQKCTAIRRALVPTAQLDTVADALATALADVHVGDPADESTQMGALVGTTQRE